MASMWHVIFLHLQRAPNNNSRGPGQLGTLSEQHRSYHAACQVPRSRNNLRRGTKHCLLCAYEPRVNFCWFLVAFRRVKWKNEAGLKQIAASGETCGLRLNRAINQRADVEREGGRQRDREKE